MQIEMMPTDRLVPYIRNAGTHSADQVAQIAAFIAEFGFTNPILIGADEVIIAEHGWLQAARGLGLPEMPVVQVIVLDHLSETQRRALVLADNRIVQNTGCANDMLAFELAAPPEDEFDLELFGDSDDELAELPEDLDASGRGRVCAGVSASGNGSDAVGRSRAAGVAGSSVLRTSGCLPSRPNLGPSRSHPTGRRRCPALARCRAESPTNSATSPPRRRAPRLALRKFPTRRVEDRCYEA